MADKIIMYGTEWCGDTRRAKKVFSELSVEYEYINVDRSPEAEKLVKEINKGYRSVPTIIFPDGSIVVEPSNDALKEKLKEYQNSSE